MAHQSIHNSCAHCDQRGICIIKSNVMVLLDNISKCVSSDMKDELTIPILKLIASKCERFS